MRGEQQSHIFHIYLDSPLYFRVLEFQLKHKLGRAYACLLIFIEGMKALGLIDNGLYEYYRTRYLKPLETSPIAIEQLKQKCDFCDKPAITKATHISGITKNICNKHLAELKNHPKWKIEE
ncbi:MAG: hypothetical protein QXK90_02260 [Candidatus Parvarchaeota archaeon]